MEKCAWTTLLAVLLALLFGCASGEAPTEGTTPAASPQAIVNIGGISPIPQATELPIAQEDAEARAFSVLLDGYRGEGFGVCSYVFLDVDANGTDELLVTYSDGSDDYTLIYTYANGIVNEIGRFWSRSRLLLDENGTIYNEGSNSAFNTVLSLMSISDDGTALVTMESWEIDADGYTHTTPAGTERITESEFVLAADRFYSMTTDYLDSLDWKQLS